LYCIVLYLQSLTIRRATICRLWSMIQIIEIIPNLNPNHNFISLNIILDLTLTLSLILILDDVSPDPYAGNEMGGGLRFVKKWTLHKMKRNWIKLCFFILHFIYLGGAFAPNAPPPLPTGMITDHRMGTPRIIFINMKHFAMYRPNTQSTIYIVQTKQRLKKSDFSFLFTIHCPCICLCICDCLVAICFVSFSSTAGNTVFVCIRTIFKQIHYMFQYKLLYNTQIL